MGEVFQGKSGTTYITVDPALGSGGEGTIYGLERMPDKVAKVYRKDKRNTTRERKLIAMIASPLTPEAMKQVAWPIDVIYQNNQFVGFIMPRIVFGEDLNVMYDYNGKYKNATLSTRIAIARNLCAAVNAVHNAGQICGDFNPKNINVNPTNGIITLVDTDSYHITDQSGKVYRCEVGLPPYLAKEIQDISKNGKNLANATLPTYSLETDHFALAVHIFQLLMNGCLPFATAVISSGNYASSFYQTNAQTSVANPQPSENISSGSSPFFSNIPGLTIPVYAPPLTVLPKEMQDLFKRAFVAGHLNPNERPTPVEWFHALDNMSQHLKHCNVNSNHEYSDHLTSCPWCDVERKIGRLTGRTPTPITSTTSKNISQNTVYVPPPIPPSYTPPPPPPRPTPTLPPSPPPTKKKGFGGWIAAAIIIIAIIWFIIHNINSADTPVNSPNSNNTTNTYTSTSTKISTTAETSTTTVKVVKAFNIQEINNIISNRTNQSNVSVAIVDLKNGKTYSTSNADNPFVSSGFYVPLYFAVGGANADSRLSLLATTMLDSMDNGAANEIIDNLGGISSVNTIMQNEGFPNTKFGRKFGDIVASNNGYENYTTANEAVRMLQQLYSDGGYTKMYADLSKDGISLPSVRSIYANSGQGIGTSYNVYIIVVDSNTKYAITILTQGTDSTTAAAKTKAVSIITELLANIKSQMELINE